jgi:carbon monoxide dehydrogenase subunit G
MAGFTATNWINQPPATVFESLSSPKKAPKIMPNIKSMTQTTTGAVGVGTKFHEVRLVNGKESETDLEVVAYDQPRRYGVKATQSGIDVTYFYDLKPERGGTTIDLECVVEGSGLKKLMLPIVAGVMKKEDGNHLETLKLALEGGRL